MVSLGARYKSYCANIARTFLVNPTAEQVPRAALCRVPAALGGDHNLFAPPRVSRKMHARCSHC